MHLKHRHILKGLGFIALFMLLLLSGCGRVHVDENYSAQELWNISKETFDRERYLDAIEYLTAFTLNHSGSTLIDSAQYLLAECHFMLREYIIAEAEYSRLVKNFPESDLVDDAWLKIILSFFYLSPRFDLDQKNTDRTVSAVNDFLDEFPQTDLEIRLTPKPTGWQVFRQVMTLGIWGPPKKSVSEVPLRRTKVVVPHKGINFGQWLLKVFTVGIYRPNLHMKTPPSEIIDGDLVVQRAYQEARSKLARKSFKAGALYSRMKKYPSAVIYFDTVIQLYAETPWAAEAYVERGDAYFAMHMYEEAAHSYQQYLEKYPGQNQDRIEGKIRACSSHLQEAARADEMEEASLSE